MFPELDPQRLDIVCYPDLVLRKQCAEVTIFDEQLAEIAARMLLLMHEAPGVGLAAPQVGLAIRMFVCNPTGEPENDLVVINPELVNLDGAAEQEEGCLSLPEVTVVVRRSEALTLKAVDLKGEPYERDGHDLEARVWQHETDHLAGRMIIDYMSEASKIANRRALKHLREIFQKQG